MTLEGRITLKTAHIKREAYREGFLHKKLTPSELNPWGFNFGRSLTDK